MKKRRKRRKYYDWIEEIRKGNVDKFYNSTDFDILREKVIIRDKGKCQFYLGNFTDGKHFPEEIRIVEGNTVHHIKPIRERPDLALDINNCVLLSHRAHEIIEDRYLVNNRPKKENKSSISEMW